MANSNTTSAKNTMTQKEALARAIDLATAADDTALVEKLSTWLETISKTRTKAKDSKTIQRENRAKEVAEWITTQGKPYTAAELAEALDGWNVGTDGKVTPQSVVGVMKVAMRLDLLKKDNKGPKKCARYMPLDYVEEEGDTSEE